MPYERGDVVLALFPDSNLKTAKKRPVVVVRARGLATGLQQVVVAMMTSNMSRSGHPCRVSISAQSAEGRTAGLLMDSVIMAGNLATIRSSNWIARSAD